MNKNSSNRFRWGMALCVMLVSAGCRVDFEARSVVREDGSLQRTAVWRAKDSNDKEEVITRYELPDGGAWTEETAEDGTPTAFVYTSQRTINKDQFPFTDYKRFTEAKDRAAVNRISVSTKDSWFVKNYFYHEQFKDVLDREHIAAMLDAVFDRGLTEFRQTLKSGVPDEEKLAAITHKVLAQYKPIVDRLAHELINNGTASSELEAILEELQREFTSDRIFSMIIKDDAGFNTPENRDLVNQAFEAAETKLSTELEPMRESIFGIHGLAVLQNYNFDIRLKMPGQILDSNADKVEEGFLVWEFDSSEMEQILEARSRKIYWERLGLALVGILGILIFSRRRRS